MFYTPDQVTQINLLDYEDPTETEPPDTRLCGALDPLLGSVCTQPVHKDLTHCDDSDWGMLFRWKDEPELSLIVVGELGQ